ncbi:hypothetical protein [Mangrovicoccus sp. HB161399]|uniref:hypothetical protein n=1 Tax=Mangrovicoccus sp. HB161399 TaxID=2720392 RepID=UPI0015580B6E|nr:hypothetical protein [Mangrovicoccus sp. HB161399]
MANDAAKEGAQDPASTASAWKDMPREDRIERVRNSGREGEVKSAWSRSRAFPRATGLPNFERLLSSPNRRERDMPRPGSGEVFEGHERDAQDFGPVREALRPVVLEAAERLSRHSLETGREDQAVAIAEKFGPDLDALHAEWLRWRGPDADAEGDPDGC